MSASTSTASAPAFAERTLADLAANLPGATAVFRRHKLDFCCSGQIRLRDAAMSKSQDLAALEAELNEAAAKGLPAELPEETRDFIALIQTRYHAVHRQEFPELIRLAKRVEAVHRAHPAAPFGLAGLLEDMARELENHMQKEEQVLFPLMQRGGHPMIGQPIAMMLAEHDDHGALLSDLDQITNDHTVPEDACPTWRALYAGTRKLADDMVEHIHAENNVLFPRFT
jgi:regulator of cell morphogenesis and NO signaling